MPLTVGIGQNVTGVVKYCSEVKFYSRHGNEKPHFNFHLVNNEGALIRGVSFIEKFHALLKNATSVELEKVEIKKSKFNAGQLDIVLLEQSTVKEIPEEELTGNFVFTKIKDLPATPMANVHCMITHPPSCSSMDTKTGNVALHKTTIRDETGIIPLVKWGGSFEAKVGDPAVIMHASPTKYQDKLQLTMSTHSTLEVNPSGEEVDHLKNWYSQLSEDDQAPLDVSTMDLRSEPQQFRDQSIVDEIEEELRSLERKKKRMNMELANHKSLPTKRQKRE